MTLPIVVLLAFALAHGTSSAPTTTATGAVAVVAPTPSPDTIEPCAQVLSALPVQLDGNNPRQVHPSPDDSAAVVAWGNPPIILQCGVPRPAQLFVDSAAIVFLVNDVNWLELTTATATVFTALDRAVFIRLTVPKSYTQPPLPTISDAIARVLPPVCHFPADEAGPTSSPSSATLSRQPGQPSASAAPSGPVGPLCTHRS